MTIAVTILPDQQLVAFNAAYRKAVARKRLRVFLGASVFFAALALASVGAEVNLRTFFTHFGNFVSYFNRILTLEDGSRVWTNIAEWLWGFRKWSLLLGETILISYVGTVSGAVLAFALNFLAAENTAPAAWLRFAVKRLMDSAARFPISSSR
ncbi:MAG: phnE [Bradyrhizobium sp.]|nr:phnE [Bradyrhizobium sp.]